MFLQWAGNSWRWSLIGFVAVSQVSSFYNVFTMVRDILTFVAYRVCRSISGKQMLLLFCNGQGHHDVCRLKGLSQYLRPADFTIILLWAGTSWRLSQYLRLLQCNMQGHHDGRDPQLPPAVPAVHPVQQCGQAQHHRRKSASQRREREEVRHWQCSGSGLIRIISVRSESGSGSDQKMS